MGGWNGRDGRKKYSSGAPDCRHGVSEPGQPDYCERGRGQAIGKAAVADGGFSFSGSIQEVIKFCE